MRVQTSLDKYDPPIAKHVLEGVDIRFERACGVRCGGLKFVLQRDFFTRFLIRLQMDDIIQGDPCIIPTAVCVRNRIEGQAKDRTDVNGDEAALG